jgi:hypothetical protein
MAPQLKNQREHSCSDDCRASEYHRNNICGNGRRNHSATGAICTVDETGRPYHTYGNTRSYFRIELAGT